MTLGKSRHIPYLKPCAAFWLFFDSDNGRSGSGASRPSFSMAAHGSLLAFAAPGGDMSLEAHTNCSKRSQFQLTSRSAFSLRNPASMATTAAPKLSRARCAMPEWKSSTPACARRRRWSSTPSLQEDVQVIGLSILSGAHNAIVPRVMDLLKQNKMDDVLVLVGGIIPDQDIEGLRKQA